MGLPSMFKSQARLLFELGVITEAEYVIMRSDGRFSKMIVISAVLMITIYAVVLCYFCYLNIKNHTSVFPPVEFTTGYFAFWTVEIVMLASLKKHKINNKHERSDTSEDILANAWGKISPGGAEKADSNKEYSKVNEERFDENINTPLS